MNPLTSFNIVDRLAYAVAYGGALRKELEDNPRVRKAALALIAELWKNEKIPLDE